mgnify:CR=1 FL=1
MARLPPNSVKWIFALGPRSRPGWAGDFSLSFFPVLPLNFRPPGGKYDRVALDKMRNRSLAREISQSATDEPQNDRANPPSVKVAGSGLSHYGSEINSDNATHRSERAGRVTDHLPIFSALYVAANQKKKEKMVDLP